MRSLALSVLLWSASAHAHLGSTKYLAVERTESGAIIVADVDPIDIAYDLELEDTSASAVMEEPAAVRAWAERAFELRSAGGPCRARAGAPSLVRLRDRIGPAEHVRIRIVVRCSSPRELVLRDVSVFPGDPQHEAIVRTETGETILRAGRQELRIAAAPPAACSASARRSNAALALFSLALLARTRRSDSRRARARSPSAARARAAY